MQPPLAGIFSPSIHVRLVVARKTGLMIGTARLNAHPRLCCSGRTGRTLTSAPPVVARIVVPVMSSVDPAPAPVFGSGYSVGHSRPAADRIGTMSSSYVVLLPVKPPARGKSRLEGDPVRRRALAAAFALDTARACLSAESVGAVLAITDDARFAAELRAV